jgi:hypothetical protein
MDRAARLQPRALFSVGPDSHHRPPLIHMYDYLMARRTRYKCWPRL